MKWTENFSLKLGPEKLTCLHYYIVLWLPYIFVLLTRRRAQNPCNHKKLQVVEVHPQKQIEPRIFFILAFFLWIIIENISLYACASGVCLLIQEVIIDSHSQSCQ